jgi:soluble epoxide hydrolase/lipid-phosphate phosphatase
VTHLFTCAVPYLPASAQYVPLEVVVKFLPSLGYQIQFGSEEGVIESHTQDKTGIRNYLNALYGGRTSDGRAAMTPEKGVDLELMPKLNRSVLISEDELDFYVEEYSRHGLAGPCEFFPLSQPKNCAPSCRGRKLTSNRQLLPQPQGQLRSRQASVGG